MVDIVSMILALNGATRSDQIPPRQRAQDLPDTLLLVVLPCRIVLLELMSPLKAALIKCVMAERGLELEVQFGLGGTGALASVVEGPGEPNDAPHSGGRKRYGYSSCATFFQAVAAARIRCQSSPRSFSWLRLNHSICILYIRLLFYSISSKTKVSLAIFFVALYIWRLFRLACRFYKAPRSLEHR